MLLIYLLFPIHADNHEIMEKIHIFILSHRVPAKNKQLLCELYGGNKSAPWGAPQFAQQTADRGHSQSQQQIQSVFCYRSVSIKYKPNC